MTNEAAERLRDWLYAGRRSGEISDLNEALAAERRATVDRIRAAIRSQSNDFYLEAENGGMQGLIGTHHLFAILDAEEDR